MQLESKHVLVTGGAGFIGSHLVDALLNRKAHVRVLDDLSTGRLENLSHIPSQSIEVIRGSVTDESTVRHALDGIDVVFHLACRGVRHSIGNPMRNHEVNARGSLLLLAEAKAVNVQRFVQMSSSEVYGTARRVPMDEDHPCFPETVYGAAKLAGECYARAYAQTYGLPTVVVRPFNNFGPRSHFEGDAGEVIPRFAVWAMNGRQPVIFGDGTQSRDFIYVEDTAHWLCEIAQCDTLIGQTINLASGKETTVRDLARFVCEALGMKANPVHRAPRPGDVQRHLGGMEKAKQLLGFQLRTSVAEGIGKLISHLKLQSIDATQMLAQIQEVNWKAA